MRFLLFILVCSFALLKLSLAASLSSSKSSKRTTNDQGYIFSNVYNSGMSSSQGLEILRRMKTVEEKLEKIESKGFIKGRCPQGWKVFNRSCFMAFIKPTATWNQAHYVCKSLGGDLVKITSAAENTFVYGLIAGELGNLGEVYIGLKRGGDNNFYWVDGSSVTTSFWDSGQPDGSSSCGIFYNGASVPGKWHDNGSCSNGGGYICEMPAMN